MAKKQNHPSDYKPTGCYAVDLVAACISHQRRQLLLPEFIRLTPKLWKQFALYVLKHSPECYDKDGINFDDVIVQKGHMFQVQQLVMEFPKPKFSA